MADDGSAELELGHALHLLGSAEVDIPVDGGAADGLYLSELLDGGRLEGAEGAEVGEVGRALAADSGSVDIPVPEHDVAAGSAPVVGDLVPVVDGGVDADG